MDKKFVKIVNSAKSNSEDAFETLYNMTKDSAYFVAINIAQNEQDAQDILQDSYMKAFSKIDTVDPPEMFDNWLHKIVANTAKNYIRKSKPLLFDEIDDDFSENFGEETNANYIPHQHIDNNETSRLIMEIINKLPEDKRLCVLMYYYQEMSIAEIASAIEISEANVKYRLYIARKTIKEELEALEKEGTKLYGAIPFTVLPSLIKNASKISSTVNPAPAYSAIHLATQATASVAGTVDTLKKTSGGINMIFKTTMSKVIAAVAAVAIVGGGVTTAVILSNKANETANPTAVSGNNSSVSNGTTSNSDTNTSTADSSQAEKKKSVLIDKKDSDPLYNYTLYNDHVVITKYKGNGTEKNVQIPAEFENTPVTEISETTFNHEHEDEDIESISIPEGVTTIGKSAFYDCKSLKSISFPSTLKSIGHWAFKGCESLANIDLPESTTELGQDVFDETAWYENQPDGLIYLGKTLYAYKGDMPKDTKIDITEGTKGIAGNAFNNCKNLINITIPNSIEVIGYGAFSQCKSLAEIKIPDSVTKISTMAFAFCESLTSIDIPDSIKILQVSVFRDCTSLKTVNLSNSISTISGDAFLNCKSLTDLKLPDSITYIESAAFRGCKALTSIEIPNGIKKIDDATFYDCISLTNVKLPNTVTSIGVSAFKNCKALKNIEIPDSVETIAAYAFEECTSLESITIPDSVTEFGKDVFEDCKSFTIRCNPNSEAEKYAKENNIKTESIG